MGYHCYEMIIARPLTVEEGKALHYVVDNAVEGNYYLEMTANPTELQNRYKFKSFEGTVQEGDIQRKPNQHLKEVKNPALLLN